MRGRMSHPRHGTGLLEDPVEVDNVRSLFGLDETHFFKGAASLGHEPKLVDVIGGVDRNEAFCVELEERASHRRNFFESKEGG